MSHHVGGIGDRRYPIQSAVPYWLAGSTRDGRQALVFLPDEGAFRALLFDRGGQFLAVDAPKHGPEEWQRAVGFKEGPIHVRAFREGDVLIKDLPTTYSDFLQDPEEVPRSAREKTSVRADIREWTERGRFVLVWGSEFWMEGDGTVFAT